MKLTRIKSILVAGFIAALALIYIMAPVQQAALQWAHELDHEWNHIAAKAHDHHFIAAEELRAEAGHDHRTLEYIKQVLEPFEDDLKNEKQHPKPFKMDKHLQVDRFSECVVTHQITTKASYDLRIQIHRQFALRDPVPPPEV